MLPSLEEKGLKVTAWDFHSKQDRKVLFLAGVQPGDRGVAAGAGRPGTLASSSNSLRLAGPFSLSSRLPICSMGTMTAYASVTVPGHCPPAQGGDTCASVTFTQGKVPITQEVMVPRVPLGHNRFQ